MSATQAPPTDNAREERGLLSGTPMKPCSSQAKGNSCKPGIKDDYVDSEEKVVTLNWCP